MISSKNRIKPNDANKKFSNDQQPWYNGFGDQRPPHPNENRLPRHDVADDFRELTKGRFKEIQEEYRQIRKENPPH